MSEELNDNLPVNENAVDGNVTNESQESLSIEKQEVEEILHQYIPEKSVIQFLTKN